MLYAFDRRVDGPAFSRDDEQLLEAFAASAATAVATAQEFAAHGLRKAIEASESERRRWARELHDQTLQDLGALRVGLSAARRSGDPERLAAAVDDAVAQLGSGIDELRAIITDLRPAALDELGVKAALEAFVERMRGVPNVPPIQLEIDLDYEAGRRGTRPSANVESAMYRLVQEAITNVVKHASAQHIDVSLVEHDGSVHVRRPRRRGRVRHRRVCRRLRPHRHARAAGARQRRPGDRLAARRRDRGAGADPGRPGGRRRGVTATWLRRRAGRSGQA